MITANHVTLDYKVQHQRTSGLKEYVINYFKGKITYDIFRALDDVSFEIKEGEVVGIIGRNGAGKSTLLKIIAEVMKPSKGNVEVKGALSPMLELGTGFDYDLTGRENIFLNGAILGYSKEFLESKYQEIIDFSELGEFIDQPIRTYSSGMVVRLGFSIAATVDPEILIVDEVLGVGDAHFMEKSQGKMKELISEGTTVLMVSHNLPTIEKFCKRAIWLDRGKILMDGEVKEICNLYKKNLATCEVLRID